MPHLGRWLLTSVVILSLSGVSCSNPNPEGMPSSGEIKALESSQTDALKKQFQRPTKKQ